MRFRIFWGLFLAASNACADRAWAAGVPSRYTPALESALQSWPPHSSVATDSASSGLALECYATPGDGSYVGLAQWLTVAAPLEAVAAVVDDFAQYSELFPDLKKVSVIGREDRRLETEWEEDIPIFFIPNGKYRLFYWTDAPSVDRRTYRYQLAQAGHLKESDGLIVLERLSGSLTRYTELDFIEADLGVLKFLAPKRIWKETIRDISRSDVAIQLKAEHADWANARIKGAAKDKVSDDMIDRCYADPHDFSLREFFLKK